MYDPLLTLATAVAVTERIGIGGQVTAADDARCCSANALASLYFLSDGRLTVAVGVGRGPSASRRSEELRRATSAAAAPTKSSPSSAPPGAISR